MSSYRKGGTYYEGNGEDMTMMNKTMKEVNDAKVSKLELQMLSVEEKDYLPSGWMKMSIWDRPGLQPEPISTVSGWISILDRD